MTTYTRKLARRRDQAREIASDLRDRAERIDSDDLFPAEILGLLWDAGFMTMTMPREQGGGGAGSVETVVAVEELARGCGTASLVVLLQALGASVIMNGADEKQRARLFGQIVSERRMLSLALSEPSAPADGEAMITTAKRSGSKFVIKGRKTFVSGGRSADLVIVFAQTNPRAGLKKGISAFAAPMGMTGMLPTREMPRAGLRGAPAVELVFEDAKVPASSRLGKAGRGYALARNATVAACPLAAALSCGLLAEALDYLLFKVRKRGGAAGPASEFQPLGIAVADMRANLDTARSITWSAATAMDSEEEDASRLARVAKWTATETAVFAIDQALRLVGIGKRERVVP